MGIKIKLIAKNECVLGSGKYMTDCAKYRKSGISGRVINTTGNE